VYTHISAEEMERGARGRTNGPIKGTIRQQTLHNVRRPKKWTTERTQAWGGRGGMAAKRDRREAQKKSYLYLQF
jgi:hypothetical protein